MEYKKDEIVTSNNKKDSYLRDLFIKEYSNNKGWDYKNLTTEQYKEIKSLDGYKNPGMLLS